MRQYPDDPERAGEDRAQHGQAKQKEGASMSSETKIDDGGPAFPIPIAGCNDGGVYNTLDQSGGKLGGMSLRDWFAGQALAGLSVNWIEQAAIRISRGDIDDTKPVDQLARWAYAAANAMLKARKDGAA
jgi:hypothetical protein